MKKTSNIYVVYGNEAPSHAFVFRWFTELCIGINCFQDEGHTGIPLPVMAQKMS